MAVGLQRAGSAAVARGLQRAGSAAVALGSSAQAQQPWPSGSRAQAQQPWLSSLGRRLSSRGRQALARGLSSRGCRALARRLSSCGTQSLLLQGMWDLPKSGIGPVSPALAGRFFSTEPPGKPLLLFINEDIGNNHTNLKGCIFTLWIYWSNTLSENKQDSF